MWSRQSSSLSCLSHEILLYSFTREVNMSFSSICIPLLQCITLGMEQVSSPVLLIMYFIWLLIWRRAWVTWQDRFSRKNKKISRAWSHLLWSRQLERLRQDDHLSPRGWGWIYIWGGKSSMHFLGLITLYYFRVLFLLWIIILRNCSCKNKHSARFRSWQNGLMVCFLILQRMCDFWAGHSDLYL